MNKIQAITLLAATSATMLFSGEAEKRISQFSKSFPISEFTIMAIPSAGNFISNKIVVASLNSGTQSVSSLQLSTFLAKKDVQKILIVGDNDDIMSATIKNAINSLKQDSGTPHEIGYVGKEKMKPSLEEITQKHGYKLLFVVKE